MDTENRFFDLVGNALFAASLRQDIFQHKPSGSNRDEVLRAKNDFYRDLGRFVAEGYVSAARINPEALTRFEGFRDADWTDRAALDRVVTYLHSLRGRAERPAQPL